MEKKNKMKRNIVNNVNAKQRYSADNTNINVGLGIDPVEIRTEKYYTGMGECDVRIRPMKFKVKGDNLKFPKENISVGHAEISLEFGGGEVSKNATNVMTAFWEDVAKYLGEIIKAEMNYGESIKEDQEEDKREYDEQEFDPVD